MYLWPALVGDCKVLVDTPANHAINREAEHIRGEIAVGEAQGRIGQVDTRGIEAELARGHQFPAGLIDSEVILADKARVDRIESRLASRADLAALVRHHEGTALADGDPWGCDFDLCRHRHFLPASFPLLSRCPRLRKEHTSEECARQYHRCHGRGLPDRGESVHHVLRRGATPARLRAALRPEYARLHMAWGEVRPWRSYTAVWDAASSRASASAGEGVRQNQKASSRARAG